MIVFTKSVDASKLMKAAREVGDQARELLWIGSDGWTNEIPNGGNVFDDEILHGIDCYNRPIYISIRQSPRIKLGRSCIAQV